MVDLPLRIYTEMSHPAAVIPAMLAAAASMTIDEVFPT